ncbi:hypothetical protein ABZ916_39215 [Streptomyces sp. NPDC046853]|uniref:hypothetical protein n=1 Tax=Streptomyces sp. NPDC046853 TaxID=3154920 RepID=UPI0033C9FA57
MLIPASSTEFMRIEVTAPAGVDLTGVPVRIAAVAHADNPADGEWRTAEWATATEARILVGPDSTLELARGTYRVWIHVDPAGPENITRPSGLLLIT